MFREQNDGIKLTQFGSETFLTSLSTFYISNWC